MPKQQQPLAPADAIMFNAKILADNLGVPELEIAKSALHLAVTIAEKHGDPDDYLGSLVASGAAHILKGNNHGR